MLLYQAQMMRTQQPTIKIKTKNFDEQTLNTLVNEINRLYITHRKTYLKQFIDKNTKKGETRTITYDDTKPKNYMNLPLNDELIRRHLVGQQRQNFGVINSKVTKILTFDFDILDDSIRKFYYRKVQATLHELGVEESNYIVNRSGKKGIHLTVFFDKVQTYKAKKLYKNVIAMIRDDETDKKYLKKSLNESIEMKGLKSGVKLPFSYHIETGNRAELLDSDTLKPIDDLQLCNCNPLPTNELDDILDTLDDNLDYDKHYKEPINNKELITQANKLVDSVKPLPIYKLGHDKEYTVDYFNDLLMSDNAIKEHGTRNNITYMLAIHLKDNYAMTQQTALDTLNDWISRQDTNSYTTPLKTCYKENEATVKGVYERDYHLNVQKKNISVYKSELVTILTATKVDGKPFTIKQKSILFAMLLHSKRYTNDCKQTFYMTYDQLQQTADVAKRALISQTITELADANYIKIIRRNAHHTYDNKLPNVYQLTLDEGKEKDATSAANTSNVKDKTIRVRLQINNKTFSKLIRQQFSRKEMLKLNLSRKTIEYFLN